MNRFMRYIFVALLGAGIAAQADNRFAPINLQEDIVYKSTAGGDLHLDLYYPETDLSGKYPLVVYTHGGGWAAGSNKKAGGGAMGRVVQALTQKGFCVASVQYRLVSQEKDIKIRDCVIDAKDAIRYLTKNSEALHVDAERVFTFGDSAGGQLAQMLLLTPPDSFPGAEELKGYTYTTVAGVSWYGPCDFERSELFNPNERVKYRDRFGPRILGANTNPDDKLPLYREVSPVNYLARDNSPLLMIQGDGDTTIPLHHAHFMQERADAAGAPVEILIVKNAGHNWRKADGVTDIDPPLNDIVARTVDYIDNHYRQRANDTEVAEEDAGKGAKSP